MLYSLITYTVSNLPNERKGGSMENLGHHILIKMYIDMLGDH